MQDHLTSDYTDIIYPHEWLPTLHLLISAQSRGRRLPSTPTMPPTTAVSLCHRFESLRTEKDEGQENSQNSCLKKRVEIAEQGARQGTSSLSVPPKKHGEC